MPKVQEILMPYVRKIVCFDSCNNIYEKSWVISPGYFYRARQKQEAASRHLYDNLIILFLKKVFDLI